MSEAHLKISETLSGSPARTRNYSSHSASGMSLRKGSSVSFSGITAPVALELNKVLKEACFYFVFLAVFVALSILSRGGEDSYYYTQKTRELLLERVFPYEIVPNFGKRFEDVITPGEVWEFLQGPMLNLFSDSLTGMDEYGMVLKQSRLLGGVRLRQQRVVQDSCDIQEEYQGIIKYCYSKYTYEAEDTADFGPALNSGSVSELLAYQRAKQLAGATELEKLSRNDLDTWAQYQCIPACTSGCMGNFSYDSHLYREHCAAECDAYCTCFSQHFDNSTAACPAPFDSEATILRRHKWLSVADLNENTYFGLLDYYRGSGYVVDLPINETESRSMLLDLKKEKWIDIGTRIIYVEFVLYNAFVNKHLVSRISFEFPSTGGVLPKANFDIVELDPYSGTLGKIRAFLECALVMFVLISIVQELREMGEIGLGGFFRNKWKWLDLGNILGLLAVIFIRLAVLDMIKGYFGIADPIPTVKATEYPHLHRVGYWTRVEGGVMAFVGLLMWFKVFKFCQISKRMSFLLRMMSQASKDLLFFLLMFGIFFVGFGQAGFLAFSIDLGEFRTFGHSLLTLFRSLMGDLDYESLVKSDRLMGPAFYIFFYVVVLLVLVNVFLAILNDAYSAVRQKDLASGVYDQPGPMSFGIKGLIAALRGKSNKAIQEDLMEEEIESPAFGNEDPRKRLHRSDSIGSRCGAGDFQLLSERIEALEDEKNLGGALTSEDTKLLEGVMSLEDELLQVVQLNELRGKQLSRMQRLLEKLTGAQ